MFIILIPSQNRSHLYPKKCILLVHSISKLRVRRSFWKNFTLNLGFDCSYKNVFSHHLDQKGSFSRFLPKLIIKKIKYTLAHNLYTLLPCKQGSAYLAGLEGYRNNFLNYGKICQFWISDSKRFSKRNTPSPIYLKANSLQ